MDKKKTVSHNILSKDIAPSFPVDQTGNTLTISTYAGMPDNSYENWAYSFDDILYVEKEWTDFQNGSLQIDLDGTESAIYFRGMNNSILSSLKAESSLQVSTPTETASESPTPTLTLALTSTPTLTLTPTPGGHIFLTKADLQTAVDEWASDSVFATATYGDINTWNVSAITDMSNLFEYKPEITELNIGNWDTSSVTDMNQMFRFCTTLTSLDVSNWDTSNVTNMSAIFHGLDALTSLDVSNFDTSNVTHMGGMFRNCISLTSLDVSNFNTSSVKIMASMFRDSNALTSLDLSSFDTSNVTTMYYMFRDCSGLTSLDISGWCVTKITSEPSDFATNAPFANDSNNLPVWGTCP